MPIITKFGGQGGSGGITLQVREYSVLPDAGEENEVAIVTSIPMSGYVICSQQPVGNSGLVWFGEIADITVPVAIDEDSKVYINLAGAQQYIGDAWQSIDSYIYLNGEWVALRPKMLKLYWYGNKYEDITGGWGTHYWTTEYTDSINVGITSDSEARTWTKNTIDVSNYKTLFAEITPSKWGFSLCLRDSTAANADSVASTYISGETATQVISLPIDSINGKHYVVLGASGTQVSFRMFRVWLE